jgi:hypothetical protein
VIKWNWLDARVAERAVHEAVAVVLVCERNIGDGGKFGFECSFGGDVLSSVGEDLGVARSAGDGERGSYSFRQIPSS